MEEGGGKTPNNTASEIAMASGEACKASNAASAPLFHWVGVGIRHNNL